MDQGNDNKLDSSCYNNGFSATRLLTVGGNSTKVVAAFGSFDQTGSIRLKLTCSAMNEVQCNETVSGTIDATGGTAFSFTAPSNVRFTIDTCTVDQNVSVVTGEPPFPHSPSSVMTDQKPCVNAYPVCISPV